MTKLYVVCWSNKKDIETSLKIGRLIFGPYLLQSMNYQSDIQRMGQGKKEKLPKIQPGLVNQNFILFFIC